MFAGRPAAPSELTAVDGRNLNVSGGGDIGVVYWQLTVGRMQAARFLLVY